MNFKEEFLIDIRSADGVFILLTGMLFLIIQFFIPEEKLSLLIQGIGLIIFFILFSCVLWNLENWKKKNTLLLIVSLLLYLADIIISIYIFK